MVRLKIHQIMKARRISAYALSQGTSLAYPTAHRRSRPSGDFGRMHDDTLEERCRFFSSAAGQTHRMDSVGPEACRLLVAGEDGA